MKKRPLKFLYLETGGTELKICGQMNAYNESGNFAGENEQICEFTGLEVRNGEVYEGNILETDNGERGLVVWWKAGFYLQCKAKQNTTRWMALDEVMLKNKRIIGHVLINPELLG